MEVDRDTLQYLADQPLGAPHLQEEAERKASTLQPRSAELVEMCKRISKKWLPMGRTPARRGACNEPTAQQTDIEDAVEQRGGKRGS